MICGAVLLIFFTSCQKHSSVFPSAKFDEIRKLEESSLRRIAFDNLSPLEKSLYHFQKSKIHDLFYFLEGEFQSPDNGINPVETLDIANVKPSEFPQ